MPQYEDEIGTLEKSSISFRLSGLNEGLSRNDQSSEEPVSSADSTVHSTRRKPRRRPTRKEKGKMKMPSTTPISIFQTGVTPKQFRAKMDLRKGGRSQLNEPSNR